MKITEAYRKERELKYLAPDAGESVGFYAPIVTQIIDRLKVSELLDYWCGKAALMRAIKPMQELKIQCYDPAMPGFAGDPIPMQMVTCIDVLQDVEPECIDAVLDDLKRVVGVVGFFTIRRTEEVPKIEKDLGWWLDKIMTRFELHTLQQTPFGYFLVVYALPKPLIEKATLQ